MTDKRNQILDHAILLFSGHGLINVTMDDLAKTAGISKKTLYKFFVNKVQLVEAVVVILIEQFKIMLSAFNFVSHDVVQELVLQQNFYERIISLRFIFDTMSAEKFPEALNKINDFKTDYLHKIIKKNLSIGIAKGYYRRDIDPKSTGSIYVSFVDCFLFNIQKSEAEVYELLVLFINGISTVEGRFLLEKHKTLFSYTSMLQIILR